MNALLAPEAIALLPAADAETNEMIDRMIAERLVGNYRICVGGTDVAEAERLLDTYLAEPEQVETDRRIVMLDMSGSMPSDLVRRMMRDVQKTVIEMCDPDNFPSVVLGAGFPDTIVFGRELRDPNRKGFYRDFEHKRRDGSIRRGKRGRK